MPQEPLHAGAAANASSPRVVEYEITLRDIFTALNRQRKLIAACIAATTLIGLLYAIFATPLYRAQVVLRPLEVEEGSALSALSSQFGGAAALAGIDLGGSGSDRDEYLAILKSRALGERFIDTYKLKPELFPERWDAEAGRWREQGEPGLLGRMARALSRGLAAVSGDEGWHLRGAEPSMWEAYKIFDFSIRRIAEDRKTGLVTLSMEFRDPRRAAEWANTYVAMANKVIRSQAVAEATRALDYLNAELDKATVAGLRDTIYRVIEGQLKKIMLANARPDYAFKVIDKAVVPEERVSPKRTLSVILGFMMGGLIGALGAFLIETWKGRIASPSGSRHSVVAQEKAGADGA